MVSVETLKANATPIIVDIKRFNKHHLPQMSSKWMSAALRRSENIVVGANQQNKRRIWRRYGHTPDLYHERAGDLYPSGNFHSNTYQIIVMMAIG